MLAIRNGLGGLLRFSGRESGKLFWPYAALVIAAVFAVAAATIMPTMMATFAEFEQFAAEHPDQATVTTGPGSRSITIEGDHPELMPDFGAMTGGIAVAFGVGLLLGAAAVARRLHDSGLPGFLGLLPFPFVAVAVVGFPKMLENFTTSDEPNLGLFFGLFANNVLYMASLALLAFLLARPGTKGPNRYGEPPAA